MITGINWRFLQRRTEITGKIPETSGLLYGELYLQIADGTIYFLNTNGSLTTVLTDASGFGFNKIKFSGANSGDTPIWNGMSFDCVNFSNALLSGAGIDFSSYVLSSETGQFLTKNETGCFLTGFDLSNYLTKDQTGIFSGQNQVDTENLILKNQTGNFLIDLNNLVDVCYCSGFVNQSDISYFLTGVDLSNLVSKTNTGLFLLTCETGDILTNDLLGNFLTGIHTSNKLLKTQTGNFLTKNQTGSFITLESISSFLTGIDLSGQFFKTETLDFVDKINIGDFVDKSSTGCFLTGINLTHLVQNVDTGNFVRTCQTACFINKNDTGNFVYLDGPHIDSKFLPSYVDDVIEFSNTGDLFAYSGQLGHLYLVANCNSLWRWNGLSFIEITKSYTGVLSTDSFTEGSQNLFYTTERVLQDSPVKSVVSFVGDVCCEELLCKISNCNDLLIKNETGNFLTGFDLSNQVLQQDTSCFLLTKEITNFLTDLNFLENDFTGIFANKNHYLTKLISGDIAETNATGDFVCFSETGSFLLPQECYNDLLALPFLSEKLLKCDAENYLISDCEASNILTFNFLGNLACICTSSDYLNTGCDYSSIIPNGFCGLINIIICNSEYKIPYYLGDITPIIGNYFSGISGDNDWFNINNWFFDDQFCCQANTFPQESSCVVLYGDLAPIINLDNYLWIQPCSIDSTLIVESNGVCFTSSFGNGFSGIILGNASFFGNSYFI